MGRSHPHILLLLVLVAALLLIAHCSFAFPSSPSTTATAGDDGADSTRVHTINGVVVVNKTELGGSEGIRVVVNGGEQVTYARFKDGGFTLYNLVSGTHIVEVFHPNHMFPQIRVELSAKGRRKAFMNSDGSNQPVSFPLMIVSTGQPDYFQKKEYFDIIGIAKNPMVIFMVIGIFGAVVLPKLMDQEGMKQQMREMRSNMRSAENAVRGSN